MLTCHGLMGDAMPAAVHFQRVDRMMACRGLGEFGGLDSGCVSQPRRVAWLGQLDSSDIQ